MKYKAFEICSGKDCVELVSVSKHTKDSVYCEKCEKKQKRKLKEKQAS